MQNEFNFYYYCHGNYQNMNDYDQSQPREAFFSKKIRAGKRTYYFDVKATRANDYYLTITESKKKPGESNDQPFFEKHKLFLYKEDFEKFTEGLMDSLQFIREKRLSEESTGTLDQNENYDKIEGGFIESEPLKSSFTDIDFDDLNK